jgi:hypothetical protein
MPALDGDLEVRHFEITDAEQLKRALEMPVTQTSCVKIPKDKVAEFIEAYYGGQKFIAEELNCHCMMHAYEDPYVLLTALI